LLPTFLPRRFRAEGCRLSFQKPSSAGFLRHGPVPPFFSFFSSSSSRHRHPATYDPDTSFVFFFFSSWPFFFVGGLAAFQPETASVLLPPPLQLVEFPQNVGPAPSSLETPLTPPPNVYVSTCPQLPPSLRDKSGYTEHAFPKHPTSDPPWVLHFSFMLARGPTPPF